MYRNLVMLMCFMSMWVVCVGYVKSDEASRYMQEISVTIKAGSNEGSGVIVLRETTETKDSKDKIKVAFIWTAGHVIEPLRNVRSIIGPNGESKKVIEFKDASIVKEFRQKGRRVGETKLDISVIRYSDADNNEDIALLMVLWHGFGTRGAEFYLDKKIIDVGTDLYHCGSLLGQMGANSMTKGIMSQIGRVRDKKVYDQTTVNAFPGSSGGGVFIVKNNEPQYVGMVVRGAGETFNLMVPIRRIYKWAKEADVEWALDPTIPMPTLEELKTLPIEGPRSKDENKVPTSVKRRIIDTDGLMFLDGHHKEIWLKAGYSIPLL